MGQIQTESAFVDPKFTLSFYLLFFTNTPFSPCSDTINRTQMLQFHSHLYLISTIRTSLPAAAVGLLGIVPLDGESVFSIPLTYSFMGQDCIPFLITGKLVRIHFP